MKTTFINQNSENNIKESGIKYMDSRIKDFEFFMKCRDLEKDDDQHGSFFNYGLCFGYVELEKPNEEDYFRYQLSWGGPSDEIRFYEDGRIEYVYLDWFCGVGFEVTKEDWAIWLKDWFEGCDSMNFEQERENYDYYSILQGEEIEEE